MFGVYRKGGEIGFKKTTPVATFEDKEDAKAYAARMRKQLSPGERQYYKLSYVTREITK